MVNCSMIAILFDQITYFDHFTLLLLFSGKYFFLIIDFPFYKMPEAKGPETEALDSGVFSIPIENAPG